MKAKDTVMGEEQQIAVIMENYPDCEPSIYLEKGVMDTLLQAQAEISFKAGMKEVVDTYRQENPSSYNKYKVYWEIKQKEWGIWEE